MNAQPTPVFPRGIVPSMNTPFLDDGSVDLDAVRRSAEQVIADGVAGLLILAVAAETASLDLDEKRAIAQAFLHQVGGRVPVIVGCSSAEQADRLRLAAMARELGAPAMLCQAPAGLRGEALLAQMAELAAVGPAVLMVQDLDFGGPGLPLEDILLLHRRLPAFRCLKIEAALPGPKYSAVLQATHGQMHVSGGWAVAQMMEALRRGVHAFIPTTMEPIYVEIHRRFAAGDADGARALHERLMPVLAFSNQHIDVSIRFFKALRHRQGLFRSAYCRAPVTPLDNFQQVELEIQLERALALERELKSQSFSA